MTLESGPNPMIDIENADLNSRLYWVVQVLVAGSPD